ncbi:MAG TPA: sugar ABC transporter substrate-binding protein [Humibacter sp.]|nr:sugar ABC transporter substrate-binding protein [Humibacter sp.]
MKRIRQLGGMAVALAALIALTGCGRTNEAPPAAAAANTIPSGHAKGTVTMWAMGTEGELLQGFVSTFEKSNPGVKVNVTAIPWGSAYSKFQTAIAAGNTPDIAMMGTTWMPDFANAFSAVPTNFGTTDFFPGAVDSTKVGGHVTGVPWYVDTRVLYYRTDLAAKAGWTNAPTSWDQLKQLASDLKSKAGAKYGFNMPAGDGSFQSTLWMPWSNGADLTTSSKWTLDTPAMVKAYEYYESFFKEGLADATPSTSAGSQEANFVNGSVPMFVDGPYELGQLAKIGGKGFVDKYATAPLPTQKSSTSFTGGSDLVVFDKSKNKNAAWKLAQWLSKPDVQADWYKLSGDLPAVQSAWQTSALSSDKKLAVFGEQLKTAKAPPSITSWVQVSAAADAALETIRRGTATVPDAFKNLQSKADSIGIG